MQLESWKRLEISLVLSALPWLEVYKERVQLEDGRTLDDFYRVALPDFAAVVPITEAGELVMIRTYKHGVGRVSLSSPAGLVNPGESPLLTAQRELLEETGYAASDWRPLGGFTVDGNRQCGKAHFFLARNATRVAFAHNPDRNEVVEVQLISPHNFLRAVEQGDVAMLATVGAVSLAMLALLAENGLRATGFNPETTL